MDSRTMILTNSLGYSAGALGALIRHSLHDPADVDCAQHMTRTLIALAEEQLSDRARADVTGAWHDARARGYQAAIELIPGAEEMDAS